MKALILFCFFSISISIGKAQNQQPIGLLVSGVPTITVNKDTLLKRFSDNMKIATGITVVYDSAKIVSYGSDYMLLMTGAGYKAGMYVIQTNSKYQLALLDTHITCTTSACASETFGCVPTSDMTPSCTECANKGTCTKTTSNKSLVGSFP